MAATSLLPARCRYYELQESLTGQYAQRRQIHSHAGQTAQRQWHRRSPSKVRARQFKRCRCQIPSANCLHYRRSGQRQKHPGGRRPFPQNCRRFCIMQRTGRECDSILGIENIDKVINVDQVANRTDAAQAIRHLYSPTFGSHSRALRLRAGRPYPRL